MENLFVQLLIGVIITSCFISNYVVKGESVEFKKIEKYAQYSIDRLLKWYEPTNGVFIGHLSYPPDWCRGNSLTILSDYFLYFSDSFENKHLEGNITNKIWQVIKDMQDYQGNDFYQTAEYFDDVLWWCLAYTRAYQVALHYNDTDRAHRFLSTAVSIHNVVAIDSCAHSDTCGGGCYWSRAFSYKNAITNELYFSAATNLALLTGNETFYSRAAQSFNWIYGSGMLNGDNLIVDGLDNDENCVARGGIYTYNQGVLLGGLANMPLLHKKFAPNETTEFDYVALGERIVAAAMTKLTDANGILAESGCGDGGLFKGVFARYLRYFIDTATLSSSEKYLDFLAAQFTSLWFNNRDADTGLFGGSWAGPPAPAGSQRDHNLQVSGIDLINSLSSLTGKEKTTRNVAPSVGVECSSRGVRLNSICYCDERFSGTECEKESSWIDYFNGKAVTLSVVSGSGLLCTSPTSAATAIDKLLGKDGTVSTCLSDDKMQYSTFLPTRFAAASSDQDTVQLVTSTGDLLGFLPSDGTKRTEYPVVVYPKAIITADNVNNTLFSVFVVSATATTPESVSFQATTDDVTEMKLVLTVKTMMVNYNHVVVMSENMDGVLTTGSLFVSNLQQVCK